MAAERPLHPALAIDAGFSQPQADRWSMANGAVFAALAGLSLLAQADGVDAAPGLTPAKPNVVVVLTDDEPALDGRPRKMISPRDSPDSTDSMRSS